MGKQSFKQMYSFEKRSGEAKRIKEKYPDRFPVIVEPSQMGDIPDIDKHKFLVPGDLTFGQFQYIIRKRIKLSPEKAMFMFVENTIPPTAELMSSIYKKYANSDFFLYILYSSENTFGVGFL